MAKPNTMKRSVEPVQIPGLPVIPWAILQKCAKEIGSALEHIPYSQWQLSEYPKRYETTFEGFGPLSVEIQIVEFNAEYLQALISVDGHTWTMAAGLENGAVVGTTAPSLSIVIPAD